MRVLLVEDNPTLANSLKDALTHARFAVDCMHDGEAADHVLRTQDYALVILDLGLPKLDGLEVLRRLRQRRNPVPVLILTAHGSVEDRVKGLDLGADDYLAKPFELTELEARARALIRRSHGHEGTRMECGPLAYDSVDRSFRLDGEPLALTPRERAVLDLIVHGKANKVIAGDLDISQRTVEIHRARVMEKTQAGSLAHLVRMVLRLQEAG